MIIAIILMIGSIGILCWLLFNLAVYALPFFVGLEAGQWAHSAGAGILGAIVVGVLAAVATFVAAQILLVTIRSPWVRGAIAVLFVAPAAVAGFSVVHGLAKMGVPSEIWRDVFGVIGAVVVGASAWVRLISTGVLAPDANRGPIEITTAPN